MTRQFGIFVVGLAAVTACGGNSGDSPGGAGSGSSGSPSHAGASSTGTAGSTNPPGTAGSNNSSGAPGAGGSPQMPSGGGSQGGGFPTPDPCVGTPMDGDACTATTAGAAGGFNPGAFGACSSGTLICVCFNSTYTCFDPTNIGAGGAFSFGAPRASGAPSASVADSVREAPARARRVAALPAALARAAAPARAAARAEAEVRAAAEAEAEVRAAALKRAATLCHK